MQHLGFDRGSVSCVLQLGFRALGLEFRLQDIQGVPQKAVLANGSKEHRKQLFQPLSNCIRTPWKALIDPITL